MKQVSFEVAKAIKKAGYPQGITTNCYITSNLNQFYKEGQLVDNTDDEWSAFTKHLADVPTYLDVWLWLWREKNIYLGVEAESYPHDGMCVPSYIDFPFSDPEEAIIAALEYLSKNNLIK